MPLDNPLGISALPFQMRGEDHPGGALGLEFVVLLIGPVQRVTVIVVVMDLSPPGVPAYNNEVPRVPPDVPVPIAVFVAALVGDRGVLVRDHVYVRHPAGIDPVAVDHPLRNRGAATAAMMNPDRLRDRLPSAALPGVLELHLDVSGIAGMRDAPVRLPADGLVAVETVEEEVKRVGVMALDNFSLVVSQEKGFQVIHIGQEQLLSLLYGVIDDCILFLTVLPAGEPFQVPGEDKAPHVPHHHDAVAFLLRILKVCDELLPGVVRRVDMRIPDEAEPVRLPAVAYPNC